MSNTARIVVLRSVLAGALALAGSAAMAQEPQQEYFIKRLISGLCAGCASSDSTRLTPIHELAPPKGEPPIQWAAPPVPGEGDSNLAMTGDSLSFATTAVGEVSVEKQIHFTVTSNRITAIKGLEVVSGGENFTAFTNCPGSGILPGTFCSIKARFTPEYLGPQEATVLLHAEDPASPIEITLSGESFNREPGIELVSGVADLGVARTDRPLVQTFVFKNTGDGILNVSNLAIQGQDAQYFSIAENSCGTVSWVEGRNTCEIKVSFAPDAERAYFTGMSFETNVEGPASVMYLDLKGTGLIPYAELSGPTPLVMGVGPHGQPHEVGFQFRNTSAPTLEAPLTISNVAVANPQYFQLVGNTCINVEASASCELRLRLVSESAGPRTTSISFDANTRSGRYSIPVSGGLVVAEGPVPGMRDSEGNALVSSQVDFGIVDISYTSAARSFTLVNQGDEPVTGLGLSLPAPFILSHNCPSTLASMAQCTLNVSVRPTSAGVVERAITYAGAGVSRLPALTFRAEGQTRNFSLSTSSLSFGAVSIDAWSGYRPVTITNASSSTMPLRPALALATTTGSAEFQVTGCSQTLAPGEACVAQVRVKPTTTAAFNGTLTLTGARVPYTVSLSGSGSSVQFEWVEPSADLGVVDAGGKGESVTLTLRNTGAAAASLGSRVFSAWSSGAPGASFVEVVSDNCSNRTHAAGATCQVVVRAAPPWLHFPNAGAVQAPIKWDTQLGVGVPALSTAPTVLLEGHFRAGSVRYALPDGTDVGSAYPLQLSTGIRVVLSNQGAGPVKLGSVWGTGSGAQVVTTHSDFARVLSRVSDPCVPGNVLAAGQSCSYEVVLQPSVDFSVTPNSADRMPKTAVGEVVRVETNGTWPAGVSNTISQPGVTLQGVALVPSLEFDPPLLDFGEVPEGQVVERTVRITARGGAYAYGGFSGFSDFTMWGGDVDGLTSCAKYGKNDPLPKDASCAAVVRFSPYRAPAGQPELREGTMTAHTPHQAGYGRLAVRGVGLRGALEVTEAVDFGDVPALHTWTQTYRPVFVRNVGVGQVTLWHGKLGTTVAAGPNYFGGEGSARSALIEGLPSCPTSGGSSYPRVLNPGDGCYYLVGITAPESATQDFSGEFWFHSSLSSSSSTNSNPSGAHKVSLSAHVLQAEAVLETTSIEFPDIVSQTQQVRTITLRNTGAGAMRLGTVPGSSPSTTVQLPAQMHINTNGCNGIIQPGASCDIVVGYSPTGVARNIAEVIRLHPNAKGGTPLEVSVTGNILAPQLTLSRTKLDFGNRLTHHVHQETVTLTNTGTAPLTFSPSGIVLHDGSRQLTSSSSWAAQFSPLEQLFAHECPSTLLVGASCDVSLRWAPVDNRTLPSGMAVYIYTNSGGQSNLHQLPVSGVSYGAEVTVVSAPFDIRTESDARLPGATPLVYVTLRATGPAPVVLPGPRDLGGGLVYAAAGTTCGAKLQPGEECTLAYSVNPLKHMTANDRYDSGLVDHYLGHMHGCSRSAEASSCVADTLRARGRVRVHQPNTGMTLPDGEVSLSVDSPATLAVKASTNGRMWPGAKAYLGAWESEPLVAPADGATTATFKFPAAPDLETLGVLPLEVENPGPYGLRSVAGPKVSVGRQLDPSSDSEVYTFKRLTLAADVGTVGEDGSVYTLDGNNLRMYSAAGSLLASVAIDAQMMGGPSNGALALIPTIIVNGPGDVWLGGVGYSQTTSWGTWYAYHTGANLIYSARLVRNGSSFSATSASTMRVLPYSGEHIPPRLGAPRMAKQGGTLAIVANRGGQVWAHLRNGDAWTDQLVASAAGSSCGLALSSVSDGRLYFRNGSHFSQWILGAGVTEFNNGTLSAAACGLAVDTTNRVFTSSGGVIYQSGIEGTSVTAPIPLTGVAGLGYLDGSRADAQFRSLPAHGGLSIVDDVLVVSDIENRAIRGVVFK